MVDEEDVLRNQREWKNTLQYIEQTNAKLVEGGVYYIISKPFDWINNHPILDNHDGVADLYFPAFDVSCQLVRYILFSLIS